MKRIVEYKMQDGGSIFAEVDVPDTGIGQVSRADGVVEAAKTFDEALDQITPAAETIITKLRHLATSPDEIGVEFGIKLSGKFGALIASAEGEANFTVTLSWKPDAAANPTG